MAGADPMLPLATAVLRSRAGDPERVLAVECARGDGESALFLAREFPRAAVRGVDGSAERVRRARRRIGLDPEGRVAFKRGTPGDLPFPDDHFDLVAQSGGRLAAGEAARVLRPGGCLLVVRPALGTDLLGIRARWRRAALARGGFELLEAGEAGDGDFWVARPRDGMSRAPAE